MKTVLIIEDEPILRAMYRQKIAAAGFRVLEARDQNESLAVLEKEKPDLILLDILLPQGNGIDILRHIRQNQRTRKIKALALSNLDAPETKRQARELGVLDYLIKTNYTPKQLIAQIIKFL